MKLFIISAAIGMAVMYPMMQEQEQREQSKKLWCDCLSGSDGTDTEVEDCDWKYDPQMQLEADEDCEEN